MYSKCLCLHFNCFNDFDVNFQNIKILQIYKTLQKRLPFNHLTLYTTSAIYKCD